MKNSVVYNACISEPVDLSTGGFYDGDMNRKITSEWETYLEICKK
jgi:hypothetical protein